jgi:hypothetical protein
MEHLYLTGAVEPEDRQAYLALVQAFLTDHGFPLICDAGVPLEDRPSLNERLAPCRAVVALFWGGREDTKPLSEAAFALAKHRPLVALIAPGVDRVLLQAPRYAKLLANPNVKVVYATPEVEDMASPLIGALNVCA